MGDPDEDLARTVTLNPQAAGGTADVVRSALAVVAGGQGKRGRAGAAANLPRVLSDVPVAILVINQDSGLITYANRAAQELAPDLVMPVSTQAWAADARILGLDGEPLGDHDNPLAAVAHGRPVAGEALRRITGSGGEPSLLWATGFPLSRPENPERLSLVVLLEITPPHGGEDPGIALQALRERAIIATDLGFSISDPRQPDNPLIWVNPAFTSMTGHTFADSAGRNCRFLQGPATDPQEVARLRDAIAEQRSATVVLLNYRKDGTAFWNQLSVTPIFDGGGELVSYVGVQADVTERVEADRDLAAAHAAERRARDAAETGRRRGLLLAEATTLLSATLNVEEGLDRLARLVVPLLCDWAVITLVDPDGTSRIKAMRHRDGRHAELDRYAALLGDGLREGTLQRRVQVSGEPVLMQRFPPDYATQSGVSESVLTVASELGLHSAIVVPLVARRVVLGTLTLISGSSERVLTPEDRDNAADLGRRAGLALDNARLYQREHRVAETLQRNLLPTLPEVPGLGLAAAYLAGDEAAQVGGDFYEVLDLPSGSIGVAVGDVVGHDITAAVRMGQLRSHLRGTAWESSMDGVEDPAAILERLDRLIQGLAVLPLASACYLTLVKPSLHEQAWTVTYSNAGHPHVLVRSPAGTVTTLNQADGLVLGVSLDHTRATAQLLAEPGSHLILYTDGLVERRDSDLDRGHETLVDIITDLPAGADAATVCQRLVDHAGRERADDVAVLVVALQ